MVSNKILSILVILFLIVPLSAGTAERPINLAECIEIALQNHPDKFIANEGYKSSVASYRVARALKSVIIDGEIRTIETDKDDDDTDSSVSLPGVDSYIGLFAGITIAYNLYNAKSNEQEQTSKINIDISKVDQQNAVMNIQYSVRQAYIGYLLAKKTLEVRDEMSLKYKRKAELARRLFENGARPVLDVSKAEVDLADARMQNEKARNNERKMKLNLFHAMGLQESEEMNILPSDFDSLPELSCPLSELYTLSEVFNPLIRKTKLEKKIAQMKIAEEKASHYPKVDLLMGFGYKDERLYGASNFDNNFKNENWEPVFYGLFKASIPIYSGGSISSKTDIAVSKYNTLVYKEKETLINSRNEIRNSYKSLGEIKKQMEISRLIISNSERHLLLANRSYENGVGSLLELQDAELSVIKAKMGFLEARYNYFLTVAKLIKIVGVGEDMICKNINKNQQ